MSRIPISEAAFRLNLTYNQVRQRLFRGELNGGRDAFGRFYVELGPDTPDREPLTPSAKLAG